MFAHRKMQPDSELLKDPGDQVLVARNEPDDFGAAIHASPSLESHLLEALAQPIAGAEQQYT